MSRTQHLQTLLATIEAKAWHVSYFRELYYLLLREIRSEKQLNPDRTTNAYLNNLEQTREKQAEGYIDASRKRPVSGAAPEYRSFTEGFSDDVQEAISVLTAACRD